MVTRSDAFRLSGIQAEGWNAAKRLAPSDVEELDRGKLAALNPYTIESDRSRWTEGFNQALAAEDPIAQRKALL